MNRERIPGTQASLFDASGQKMLFNVIPPGKAKRPGATESSRLELIADDIDQRRRARLPLQDQASLFN